VLVVDDAEMVLRSTCAVLQPRFEVFSASSLERARQVLRGASSLAVALLDWRMPGACGRQLIDETIRSCPDAYIIILTGDMTHGLVANPWGEPGPHAILAKPCAPRIVIKQVEQGAAMHRKRESLRAT
jgi:DNA-binding NtrC family response regulator